MSQFKFDRRRFLAAGSSLVVLPLFESLWPARVIAAEAAKTKLAILNFPLGAVMHTWRPDGSGTNFSLPDQLSSLEPYKSELIIPTSVDNHYAGQNGLGNGTHARSAGCFLTCVAPGYGEDVRVAKSIDRVISDQLGISGSPRTIQLGAPGQGYDDFGYSGVYQSNISWSAPTQPAARVTDSNEAFKKIFGAGTGGGDNGAAEAAKRARLRKSILDGAIGEIGTLNMKLGTTDRQRLEQYLTGLREVERSVASVTQPQPMNPMCTNPQIQGVGSGNFEQFVNAMIDMIVLGMSCDLVQVATFIMDYEFNSHYVNDYHNISHYNSQGTRAEYQRVSKWFASRYARLLGGLANYKDANGEPLLKSSIAVIGSGLSDADQHSADDLPVVVAGRGGGMQPGKIIDTNAPIANLWASIAGRMGVNVEKFGDGTGRLNGV